jgi:hypothetical protein
MESTVTQSVRRFCYIGKTINKETQMYYDVETMQGHKIATTFADRAEAIAHAMRRVAARSDAVVVTRDDGQHVAIVGAGVAVVTEPINTNKENNNA